VTLAVPRDERLGVGQVSITVEGGNCECARAGFVGMQARTVHGSLVRFSRVQRPRRALSGFHAWTAGEPTDTTQWPIAE
jgi:hypothetical protein